MEQWKKDARQRQAEMEAAYAARKQDATAKGAHAFNRLLILAEESSSREAGVAASFIADIAGNGAFRFVDLRGLADPVDDDIIACIDAIRWAKISIFDSVPDGERRALAVVRMWEDELDARGFMRKTSRRVLG